MKILEKIKNAVDKVCNFLHNAVLCGFMIVVDQETYITELRKDVPETQVSDEEAIFMQNMLKVIAFAAVVVGGSALATFLAGIGLSHLIKTKVAKWIVTGIVGLIGLIATMISTVFGMLRISSLIPSSSLEAIME